MTSYRSSFGLDPDIQEQLREMGASTEASVATRTRALFAGQHDLDIPPGGARHFDVAYGVHPLQRLDICVPTGRDRPVVLVVPASGADKSACQHVAAFFARRHFVSVVMNYRTSPEPDGTAGVDDVAAVLEWIAERIADCAGDPAQVFIVAHSEGAAHAASAIFDPQLRPACHAFVRAAVLVSGLYRNDLPSTLHKTGVAATIATAELDPETVAHRSEVFAERLAETGDLSRSIVLESHNHFSPLLGIGIAGDLFGDTIVAAFERRL